MSDEERDLAVREAEDRTMRADRHARALALERAVGLARHEAVDLTYSGIGRDDEARAALSRAASSLQTAREALGVLVLRTRAMSEGA